MAKKKSNHAFLSVLFALVALACGIMGIIFFLGDAAVVTGTILGQVTTSSVTGFKLLEGEDPNAAVLTAVILFSVGLALILTYVLLKLFGVKSKPLFAGILFLAAAVLVVGGIFSFLVLSLGELNFNLDLGQLGKAKTQLGYGAILAGLVGISGGIVTLLPCAFEVR